MLRRQQRRKGLTHSPNELRSNPLSVTAPGAFRPSSLVSVTHALRRKEVPPLVSLCPSPPGSNLTLQTARVVRSQVAKMLARMGSNFVDLVIQLMLQRLDAWRAIARLFLIPESGKKA